MDIAKIALLASLMSTVALAADPPPAKPAAAPLLNGGIEFTPPEGWKEVKTATSSETQVTYLADDRDGFFALLVLPENAASDAKAAQTYVNQLRVNHNKANQTMVKPPALENDDRFAFKIHERYKTKDGKTADESYVYRLVDGRLMEIHVQSISDDMAHVAQVRKIAEDVLLSAHFKVAAPAAPGAPAGAAAPAAPAVPPTIGTVLNGRIEFNEPPAPWTPAKLGNINDNSAVAYGVEATEAMLLLRVLPSNASIGPAVAKDIALTLRKRHKSSNQEIIAGPDIEKDPRFPIRIHERFREKSGGKVVDETHLYMQVAGRAVEVDVHTVSDDPAQMAADRKAAEDVLVSTHWQRARPVKKP